MNYELSQHARDAMAKRKIATPWLEHALANPTRVEPDGQDPSLEHRLAAITQFGNRVLRVVVNSTVSPINVVTVYFDRSMKGKL